MKGSTSFRLQGPLCNAQPLSFPVNHNDSSDRVLIAGTIARNIPFFSLEESFDPGGLARFGS